MSFSADVKKEIRNAAPKKECCLKTAASCFDVRAIEESIMGKCCIKTFLKTAFLEYGSVNDPENSYHLELVTENEQLSALICAFMNDYGMGAKIMLRNGMYVVYIKGAEAIADFLKLTGAANSLMYLENTRIVKEMRGNINRGINCESANIQKKIDAAFKQLESIKYIEKTVGLDYLPDNLRELAELRLKNHEMGLAELGEKLKKKISKSGVNHRMIKIMEIAENLKIKGEM